MNRKNAIWFAAGLVCGIGLLAIALSVVPRQAPAAAPAPDIDNSRVGRELLSLAKSLNEIIGQQTVEPSADAMRASLTSDLQTLRSQLELYAVQHKDKFPGRGADGKFDGALFAKQLTGMTDGEGRPRSASASHDSYGPYLARLPDNPFVTGIRSCQVSGGPGPVPGDGTTGWYFNTRTHTFSANDPDHNGL